LRGHDHKPSASIAGAIVPEVQAAGPLLDIELPIPISVKDFAVRINQKMNVVLKKLLSMGVFANINQNLGEELVGKLANSFGLMSSKAKPRKKSLLMCISSKKMIRRHSSRVLRSSPSWDTSIMVRHPA